MREKYQTTIAVVLIGVIALCQSAIAEDYPYSGYFSFEEVKTKPELMQAKCALDFYKQNTDGTTVAYILDLGKYRATGEVKYLIVGETRCHFNPDDKTDFCSQVTYDSGGATPILFFDSFEHYTGNSFSNVNFSSRFELDNYLRSKDKALPNPLFPSGLITYSQRCIGFSDERLKSFITDHRSDLSSDESQSIEDKNISTSDIPMVLDIMQKIGPEAMNATLPGQ